MPAKTILFIACSIDGFIADENEDLSFLEVVAQEGEDYGYNEFIDQVGTVLMGRKTYEKVQSFGIPFPHADKKCYVISKTISGSDENVEFYGGDLSFLLEKLKAESDSIIFCDGGAQLVKTLMNLDLIDELIISTIPCFLGKGIRLFEQLDNFSVWKLLSSKAFAKGLVQNHYVRV